MKTLTKLTLVTLLFAASSVNAFAAGMKPEHPVLFIDDKVREATINVENTEESTALLHSSLQTIPEEGENRLIITPQLARVEPGKKQQVRVLLKEGIKLTHQTLQRINFIAVPAEDGDKNRVRVTIGQNIPVILSPASLPVNTTPWKGLKARRAQGAIVLENPTPWLVRLTTQAEALPGNQRVTLPKTYILPQETLTLPLSASSDVRSLQLHPVTRFGILTSPWQLDL